MGPRVDLDGCGKSRLLGFDPWTFQPVVSRYSGPTAISIPNKNLCYMRFTLKYIVLSSHNVTMFPYGKIHSKY